MHGNLVEWTHDWFGEYGAQSITDPLGVSEGSTRVYRGGGWHDAASSCRAAYRRTSAPVNRTQGYGLRLALSLVHSAANEKGGNPRDGQFKPTTKIHLLEKIPKSFSFELDQRISDPEPGKRVWTRVDDNIFVERFPSGKDGRLRILGRTTVAGIDGTIVEKVGFEKLQVFIPDRQSEKMEIKFRFVEKPDVWTQLGTMENVESLDR